MKIEHVQDDAVIDDAAGKAYVEQFGLETFLRAERTIQQNKASRQTVDTLQAASTFLELLHIWGPLAPEIASKIKFAKYHAVRIAKALKAGEDPNLKDPVPEPTSGLEDWGLELDDSKIQAINGLRRSNEHQDTCHQPFVEEVPDEQDRLQNHLARRSTLDQSLHPSRALSIPSSPKQGQPPEIHELESPHATNESMNHSNTTYENVSPLEPPSLERSGDLKYFPEVPDGYSRDASENLPSAPSENPGYSSLSEEVASPFIPFPTDVSNVSDFNQPSLKDSSLTPGLSRPSSQRTTASSQPPLSTQRNVPSQPYQNPPPSSKIPSHSQISDLPPIAPMEDLSTNSRHPQGSYATDEEAIMIAQKHARWAISALNFEDVKTAVKELRGALESLGAL